MRGIFGGMGVAAAAAVLAVAASPAAAAVTCEFDDAPEARLDIELGAGGDVASLEPDGFGVLVRDNSTPVTCSGPPQGTGNLDTVYVDDRSGGSTTFILNQLNATPYPFFGADLENGGSREIEMDIEMRNGGRDRFGFSNFVHVVYGASGINPNAGPAEVNPDDDIFVSGTELFTADGAGGDDVFDARGGPCCGGAFPKDLAGIVGGIDDDRIYGGAGDDGGKFGLDGQPGEDTIRGGPGRDRLRGGPDPDLLAGGGDRDTVTYRFDAVGVSVTIGAGAGDDGGSGDGAPGARDTVTGSVEHVVGTSGDDRLVGDGSGNRLVGRAGVDILLGLKGNDFLKAKDGERDAKIKCGKGRDDRARIDRGLDPQPRSC